MTQNLKLTSTVKNDGYLEVSLTKGPLPEPGDDEVVIRVEATPINPSDLGSLIAGADLDKAMWAAIELETAMVFEMLFNDLPPTASLQVPLNSIDLYH